MEERMVPKSTPLPPRCGVPKNAIDLVDRRIDSYAVLCTARTSALACQNDVGELMMLDTDLLDNNTTETVTQEHDRPLWIILTQIRGLAFCWEDDLPSFYISTCSAELWQYP